MKTAPILRSALAVLFALPIMAVAQDTPGGRPASSATAPATLAPAQVPPAAAGTPDLQGGSFRKDVQSQKSTLERLKQKNRPPLAEAASPITANCSASGSCSNPAAPHRFSTDLGNATETDEYQEKIDFLSVRQAVEATAAPLVVPPEVPIAVKLSARDINRITCQAGDIKDIVYSKEKGMAVSFSGRDAFLKYKYVRKGSKTLYPPVTEMFIICGDATYNLIAVPERIPSQTVRLSSGDMDRTKKNQAYFSGMSAEKKVLALVKAVYTDEIPESFTVDRGAGLLLPKLYRDLSIMLNRTVIADGEGLRVKEYILSMDRDAQAETYELDERDFLNPVITSNPVALSLDRLRIMKGENVRLFVCELKSDRDEYSKDQSTIISINKGLGESFSSAPTESPEKGTPAGTVKKETEKGGLK
jgi:conjugal transfer pilus assembly protein TraK